MFGIVDDLRKEAAARQVEPTILDGLRCCAAEAGLRIAMQHRLAQRLQDRQVPLLPKLISRRLLRRYGIDIERGATLGYRVQLPHPVGVVIGTGAVVGDGVLIQSGVTLGKRLTPNGRPDGYPRIDKSAHLGSGTKVFGPVTVGERAEVGANSVVTSDVGPWTVAVGSPARHRRDLVRPDSV